MILKILEQIFISILIFDLIVTALARFKYKTLDTARYCIYTIIVVIILVIMIKGV